MPTTESLTSSALSATVAFANHLSQLLSFGFDWDALPRLWLPPLIFSLRTTDMTLATLRMLSVLHGRRLAAWFIGFFQALVFVAGVAGVLDNLEDPLNLVAYAAGFATGNVIGITLEARLAPGHSLLRVISAHRGNAIAESLRSQGWGVTEMAGRGMGGTVSFILCNLPRREVKSVRHQVVGLDPEAFVTVEHVRSLRGGWRA